MSYRDDAVKRAFEIYNHGVYYAWAGGHATFFTQTFDGVSRWGMDCSGFCSAVAFGYTGKTVNQSWTSGSFANAGKKGFNGIQIGDILYKNGHCGVYLGDKVMEAKSWTYRASTTNKLGWNYKAIDWSEWKGYYSITSETLTLDIDDYGITDSPPPPSSDVGDGEQGNDGTQQGDSNEMREDIYLFLLLTRYTKDKKKSYKRSRLL